jgi:hypothetical protein
MHAIFQRSPERHRVFYPFGPEIDRLGADFISLLHSPEGVKGPDYPLALLAHQRSDMSSGNGLQIANRGAPLLVSSLTVSLAAARTGPAMDKILSR